MTPRAPDRDPVAARGWRVTSVLSYLGLVLAFCCFAQSAQGQHGGHPREPDGGTPDTDEPGDAGGEGQGDSNGDADADGSHGGSDDADGAAGSDGDSDAEAHGDGSGDANGSGDADGDADADADGTGDADADADGTDSTDDDQEVAETVAAAQEAAAQIDPEQTADAREVRESRFVGDAQDARSTTTRDDLPPADTLTTGVLVDMATYDLTFDITPYAWIRPEGLLQVRWTGNYRSDPSSERAFTHSFTIPRARFALWVGVTEYLRFRMRFGVSSGGGLNLEQAFADAALGPFTLRVGRFWLPVYGGGGPAPNLLTKADYSFAANYLDGGQTQGASLSWGTDHARLRFFIGDGLRTGFAEFGQQKNADFALTGRIDARWFTAHEWTRFDEFSSFRGSDVALRFGAAVHGQHGGETGTTEDIGTVIVTADVQLEGDGYHVFAAGGWVRATSSDSTVYNNFGLEVQAGYFVLEPLEMWAAYDALLADGKPQPPALAGGTGETNLHTFSAGLTWYIVPRAHRAKLQAQVDYILGGVDTSLSGPTDNNALLPSSSGSQFIGRIQLTMAF